VFINGVMNVNSNDPLRPVKTIPVKLTVGVVGIENNVTGIPTEFSLAQNYPNPFNPTTNISFAIPTESFVSIKIYDILGKEVSKIVNETKQAGYYNFNFDATSLSSGMYFYKIEAGNFVQTKRMLLMK
jgi:flagellar hook assembly protein FlgD